MKEKIVDIIQDYIDDAKEFWKLLKNKFYHYLNDPKMQKKYIITASILLLLTILIANIFNSYAYYFDETEGFTIINAKVGNMYIDDYDYTLLVFVESSKGSGVYQLSSTIPNTGYTYNGYSCLKNSTLVYSDNEKITRTNLKQKDVCSIYFNYK